MSKNTKTAIGIGLIAAGTGLFVNVLTGAEIPVDIRTTISCAISGVLIAGGVLRVILT